MKISMFTLFSTNLFPRLKNKMTLQEEAIAIIIHQKHRNKHLLKAKEIKFEEFSCLKLMLNCRIKSKIKSD